MVKACSRPRTATAGGEGRSGTKIPRPRGHAGSSPASGTIDHCMRPALLRAGDVVAAADIHVTGVCDHGRAPTRRAPTGSDVQPPYRLDRLDRPRIDRYRAGPDVVSGMVVARGTVRRGSAAGPGGRPAEARDAAPPVSGDRALPLRLRVDPSGDPPVLHRGRPGRGS